MSRNINRTVKGIYCPHCGNIATILEIKECPVCGKKFPPLAAKEPELVTFEHDGGRGVAGLNDHRVYVLPEHDIIYVRSFCDIIAKKDGKYAFVGGDGKVDFLYDDYCPRLTVEGQYIVRIADKVGCVDREGNVVVPIKFDYMLGDEGGLDGKSVMIDENGNVLPCDKQCRYTYCERVDDAHHVVKSNLHGTYHIVDSFGKEEDIISFHGFYSYEIDNCVIKVSWRPQVGPGYFMPETWVEGYRLADLCDQPTCLFSVLGLGQFHEGMAQFKMYDNEELGPDEWGPGIHEGYIGCNWERQIPPIYDQTSPFLDGYARVRKDNELFFIDKKGDRVPDSVHLDETKYPFIAPASELKHGPGELNIQGPADEECRDSRNADYHLDEVTVIDERYVYIDQYGREADVIEVVPMNNLSEKHIGRMLAKAIYKHWIEDFVNEDIGEIEPIQRSTEIIGRSTTLRSSDLQDLHERLDAGENLDSMVLLVKEL